MKASTFFLGLTTGSIAAAVTVLYSTPKSGNEMRQSLKMTRSDWREAFQELKLKTNQLTDSISNLSTEQLPIAVNRFKKSVDQLKDPTEQTQKRFEEELIAIQESLEKLEQSVLSESRS